MRGIKVFILVSFIFSFISLNVQADYLDVGDDPSKIEIVSTQEISVPSGYKFKGWSPNGEYFSVTNEVEIDEHGNIKTQFVFKTIIYNKEGQLFKQFNGRFELWLSDSQKIIVMDKKRNIELIDITNNQINDVEIELKEFTDFLHCINPENNNLIYNHYEEIFEYNINTKKSNLIVKPAIGKMAKNIKILKDFLIYRLRVSKRKRILYKLNLNNNSLNKIISGKIFSIKINQTKSKNIIIAFNEEDNIIFCNINGETLLKMNITIGDAQPDDEGYVDYFNSEYMSIAPNGKLFCISYGKFTELADEYISGDIYIINMKGIKVNITNTSDKVEIVRGWSPQGDRLIYYEYPNKKHYIMKLSRIN